MEMKASANKDDLMKRLYASHRFKVLSRYQMAADSEYRKKINELAKQAFRKEITPKEFWEKTRKELQESLKRTKKSA